jgi:hypothetical protein
MGRHAHAERQGEMITVPVLALSYAIATSDEVAQRLYLRIAFASTPTRADLAALAGARWASDLQPGDLDWLRLQVAARVHRYGLPSLAVGAAVTAVIGALAAMALSGDAAQWKRVTTVIGTVVAAGFVVGILRGLIAGEPRRRADAWREALTSAPPHPHPLPPERDELSRPIHRLRAAVLMSRAPAQISGADRALWTLPWRSPTRRDRSLLTAGEWLPPAPRGYSGWLSARVREAYGYKVFILFALAMTALAMPFGALIAALHWTTESQEGSAVDVYLLVGTVAGFLLYRRWRSRAAWIVLLSDVLPADPVGHTDPSWRASLRARRWTGPVFARLIPARPARSAEDSDAAARDASRGVTS